MAVKIIDKIIMHISNIVQEKISKVDKSKRKNAPTSLFSIDIEREAEEAPVITMHPKCDMGGVWILQEMDLYNSDKELMQMTSTKILDSLNELRIALLNQQISHNSCKALKDILNQSQITLQFPELQNMLDEIKLRLEIEIAKLEKLNGNF